MSRPNSVRILHHGGRRALSLAHVYGGPVSSATAEELAYFGITHILAYGLAGGLGTKGIAMGDFYLVTEAWAFDGTTPHYSSEALQSAEMPHWATPPPLLGSGWGRRCTRSARPPATRSIARTTPCSIPTDLAAAMSSSLDSAHLFAAARINSAGKTQVAAIQAGVVSRRGLGRIPNMPRVPCRQCSRAKRTDSTRSRRPATSCASTSKRCCRGSARARLRRRSSRSGRLPAAGMAKPLEYPELAAFGAGTRQQHGEDVAASAHGPDGSRARRASTSASAACTPASSADRCDAGRRCPERRMALRLGVELLFQPDNRPLIAARPYRLQVIELPSRPLRILAIGLGNQMGERIVRTERKTIAQGTISRYIHIDVVVRRTIGDRQVPARQPAAENRLPLTRHQLGGLELHRGQAEEAAAHTTCRFTRDDLRVGGKLRRKSSSPLGHPGNRCRGRRRRRLAGDERDRAAPRRS